MTDEEQTEAHSVSTAVVEAVAAEKGVDPMELPDPLYDVIDPDALDALFAPVANRRPASDGQIVFAYAGFDVTVASDGRIELQPRESA